jgi:hypothetical protein
MMVTVTTVPADALARTATVKISGNAPKHRSHTIDFGAYVPNRLHRGHRCPLRSLPFIPGRGLALPPEGLRILTVVHLSQRVDSAEADEFADRRFCALISLPANKTGFPAT